MAGRCPRLRTLVLVVDQPGFQRGQRWADNDSAFTHFSAADAVAVVEAAAVGAPALRSLQVLLPVEDSKDALTLSFNT